MVAVILTHGTFPDICVFSFPLFLPSVSTSPRVQDVINNRREKEKKERSGGRRTRVGASERTGRERIGERELKISIRGFYNLDTAPRFEFTR